jgi:hypothetical protein
LPVGPFVVRDTVVPGSYFVGVLSGLHDVVAPLRWVSPHKLAEPTQILLNGVASAGIGLLLAGGVGAAWGAIAL